MQASTDFVCCFGTAKLAEVPARHIGIIGKLRGVCISIATATDLLAGTQSECMSARLQNVELTPAQAIALQRLAVDIACITPLRRLPLLQDTGSTTGLLLLPSLL
jgi:hypothetical protein